MTDSVVKKLQYVVFDDDQSTFRDWQFQVEGILQDNEWDLVICHPYDDAKHQKSLDEANVSEEAFAKINSKVERFLRRCMKIGTSSFGILRDVADEHGNGQGRLAWQGLLEEFASDRTSRAIRLMTNLFAVRWEHGTSLTDFKSSFDAIWRDLRSTGKAPEKLTVVAYIIGQLPPSYDVIRKECEDAIEKDEDSLSVEGVFRKLRGWKADESAPEDQRALYSARFKNQGQGNTNHQPRKCYNCGKVGHIRSDCRQPCLRCKDHGKNHTGKDCPLRPANSSSTEKPTALITTEGNNLCLATTATNVTNLVCDSGATDHFFSDRELFDDAFFAIVDPNSSKPVQGSVKGGQGAKIVARGRTVPLAVTLVDGTISHVTFDACFVPGLASGLNIVSTSRVADKSHTFSFGKESYLTLSTGQRILLHQDRRLTFLRVHLPEMSQISSKRGATQHDTPPQRAFVTLYEFHKQLNHVNYDDTERVAHEQGVKLSDRERSFCEHCQIGKHTRAQERRVLPTASITPTSATVHTDIFGPAVASFSGKKRFAIVFLHGPTRFAFVYFMKHKSESLDCFKQFCRDARDRLTFDTLRSDNDAVYRGKDFSSFCVENNVCQQFSAPETQSQNGTAERYWRTLQDATVAMLDHAGLGKEFWTAAFSHANYLRNRLPHSKLENKSPFLLAAGTPPKLADVPTFGADVFVHIERSRRAKLDPKSRRGVFLGVSPDSETFVIWTFDTHRVITSRHVTVNDTSVPRVRPGDIVHVDEDGDTDDDDDTVLPMATPPPQEEISDTPQNDDTLDADEQEESVQDEEEKQDGTISDASSTDFLLDNDDEAWAHLCLATGPVSDDPDPMTIKQARSSNHWSNWKISMEEQIGAIINNDVFVPDDSPKSKPVKSKMVFRRKRNETGTVVRFKSRFTPKGYQQVHGLNFFETFAPVAAMDTTRTFFAIGAARNYDIEQMDIDDAFTTSVLDEDVWMEIPADLMSIPEIARLIADKFGLDYDSIFEKPLIVKLLRSIYGLKQSNRNFSELLDKWLLDNRFERSRADPCLYKLIDTLLWVLVYVDDLLIMGDTAEIAKFKNLIKQKFGIKELGPVHWYLGMEITRDRAAGTLKVSQSQYLKSVLERFSMADCHVRKSPFPSGLELPKAEKRDTDFPYRELVGSLLYAAKATRPDIAHAVGVLTRYLIAPTSQHVNAAKHVLRYIQGTLDYHVCYGSQDELTAWADSDWAGDLATRKSTTGFVIMLSGGPVAYASTLQRTVALSSAAAEYISACSCTECLVFIRQLLVTRLAS